MLKLCFIVVAILDFESMQKTFCDRVSLTRKVTSNGVKFTGN